MRLQKHLAYKYKNKEYYKHILSIPNNTLKELGWKPGEKLEQIVENGRLIIRPESNSMETSQNTRIDKTRKMKGE